MIAFAMESLSSLSSVLGIILISSIILFVGSFLILCGIIFGLAIITTIKHCWRNEFKNGKNLNSAMYVGRVNHTRYLPIHHSFGYPLWMCFLDLDESNLLFGDTTTSSNSDNQKQRRRLLWPLSYVIHFDSQKDHLKNGEGLSILRQEKKNSNNLNNTNNTFENESNYDKRICLKHRILQLVNERTERKIKELNEWLLLDDAEKEASVFKVCLLTHLRYYGYCFNPVSFYYVMMKKDFPKIDDDNNMISDTRVIDNTNYETIAIVAEVSNTPWNEMYCYVLHPSSVDVAKVQPGRTINASARIATKKSRMNTPVLESASESANADHTNGNKLWKSINYVFDKTFHVSPFMEMTHWYDWTIWDIAIPNRFDEIAISTTMIKKKQQAEKHQSKDGNVNHASEEEQKNSKYFNAFLRIKRRSMHPYRLAIFLIQFPIYCMLIQIWIHYEAFWLFLKGVAFVPHPNAAETKASRFIGNIMTPFFAIQDWYKITREACCSNSKQPYLSSIQGDAANNSSKIKDQ